MITLDEVIAAHPLDHRLVQMIGALLDDDEDLGYGICGDSEKHRAVVFKGKQEWRAEHHQTNVAFHSALKLYRDANPKKEKKRGKGSSKKEKGTASSKGGEARC